MIFSIANIMGNFRAFPDLYAGSSLIRRYGQTLGLSTSESKKLPFFGLHNFLNSQSNKNAPHLIARFIKSKL